MPANALTHVPPVAVLLAVTGLAVWAEGLYFVGFGSKPKIHLGHGEWPPDVPAPGKDRATRSVARGSGAPPYDQEMAGADAMPGTDAAVAKARPIPRLTDPVRAVGMIMFIAGLVDISQVIYIITGHPLETPKTTILASMVVIPAAWFTFLGMSQILNLDTRPVGNVAIPVALVPFLWWNFFSDSKMIQADLIIWGLAFLACAVHAYGKLPDKVLGSYLIFVSIFAFFLQPSMWALGYPLP